MISEGQDILTEPKAVADSMNIFYANIANEIGSDKNMPDITACDSTPNFVASSNEYYKFHHSVQNIRENCTRREFAFSPIDEHFSEKIIKGLNPKKATGMDNIPAKALIAAHDILAAPFARLYNKCISSSSFPSEAKRAEIIPIYKKNDSLEKKNHRPVSILTSSSKILESIMDRQLKSWLEEIYDTYLAAFRAGYSCQNVLLALCEKWKKAKEINQIPGILLVDLSKAFDCLPHALITAKLQAYGMDLDSVTLLADYLSNRHQRVKINGTTSMWTRILKGVPQGSILGPTIFNLFINDIFCEFDPGCLFNYADDNTIFAADKTLEGVHSKLSENSQSIINWCKTNEMEANPSKFQSMIASHSGTTITVDSECDINITCESSVKLLWSSP
jgi:retron-type reverse transcriptase